MGATRAVKAMVLAAGLGTRLRPLTNACPKALVELNGRTLLEIALERLREFGICDVIINTHAFAEQIADYLAQHRDFGMNLAISREEELLDTGGGLKRAGYFFADETEPFLLHNVDVISTFDLHAMLRAHKESNALATLAVQQRKNSRPLLFDESNALCGCRTPDGEIWAREECEARALAFAGIHFLSPRIFSLLPAHEKFSIISAYLALAAAGERILALEQNDAYWSDLGTPQSLAEADSGLI
jgi:MurNAc alpha-1-phosphate uridylyltransferase